MPELLDGLVIMGVGMGVVFGVLVVLMGVIVALGRRFPEEGAGVEVAPPEGSGPVPAEAEGDVVAAISVALAKTMAGAAPERVAAVARVPSAWRLAGRRQAMASRQGVMGRRGAPVARRGLRRWGA